MDKRASEGPGPDAPSTDRAAKKRSTMYAAAPASTQCQPLRPHNIRAAPALQPQARGLKPPAGGQLSHLGKENEAPSTRLPPRPPPAPPSTQQTALPFSPGSLWLPCSSEKSRQEHASSSKGRGLHVLAADVREAVASGGSVSKSLEGLLFLSGAGAINPALATRNRKTELDIREPSSEAVTALVRSFEQLRSALAEGGAQCCSQLMQLAWTCLVGRLLTASSGTALSQLPACLLQHPTLSVPELAAPRAAVQKCAQQADAALAQLGSEAAALAVLEGMLPFAVRTILPFYPTGGLFCFPWLDEAVCYHCPSLHIADGADDLDSPEHSLRHPHPAVAAVLRRLQQVHEAMEDGMSGAAEEQRQAMCRRILAAAGAAILGAHMRPGEEARHGQLDDLQGMAGAHCLHELVEGALEAAAPLRSGYRPVAAAVEVMECGARLMRLAPQGFPQAMWAVLGSLAV